ncbi:MAG: hypothetical protein AB7P37_15425 [Ramlibacter sp.]
MKFLSARSAVTLLIATLLAGCSRTVTWQEEVPLNTGETIWVTREVTYKLQGASGNPLDMGYRPDWTEELAFDWQGRHYRYVGDASLMLLAISPAAKRPVLVAKAADKQWNWQNNYRCTTPFYVQFVPDASGRVWSWPPSIEPWLYGMPYNLMAKRADLGEFKTRYTSSDRARMDRTMSIQNPSSVRVDPAYMFDGCKK